LHDNRTSGWTTCRNRQHELALMRRAEIEADLAQMSPDPEDRAEVLQMEAEFAVAQWDAFQTVDVSK
jgi:hypothetical protein